MASISSQRAPSLPLSLPSSSSSEPRLNWDVFLSFCGEDTRYSFIDHLYDALKKKGIEAFRDDENLERGTYIAPELMKAITESKYAVTVLSENYAFSRWCLTELTKIVECMKESHGLTILPVFYKVDPSAVRNQTGTFAMAFAEHEKDVKISKETIQRWKDALREVGNISGWPLQNRYESKVIQEIIGKIQGRLNRKILTVCKDLVGIDSHAKEVINIFDTRLNDVCFMGIWGMSGSGKTTLAKAVHDRICGQFQASSFIDNVREEVGNRGLVSLQKQLLYDILMEREVNIWDVYGGMNAIASRLRNMKVLIILDDVDEDRQLEALVGNLDWFGRGSRIIIISRDKQLLNRNGVYKIYEVKELDNEKALELFSQIAFKKCRPEKNYVDLSNDFLKYAKGLPLALEVLGSFLFGRTSKAWEDALHQLKENPKKEIFDTLEIGYKGLEHTTKKLFLDIACFFKGEEKNRVVDIFEGLGYYTNIDIEILIDRSLITMLGRKLWMHDLLQKLGWEIVRRESEKLGRHSRLWICQDIFHVLKSNSGTEFIEGIMLKSFPHEECLDAKAFFGMKKLGLLKICNVQLPQGLNYLSNELRLMEWHGYPLKFMPKSFQPNKLVELIMPGSRIELLPEGFSHLHSLKLIDLNGSQNLIKTPNFEGFPSLERLIFQGCTRLNEVHSSIGVLKHLTLLDLKNCKSLKSFPHEINLESLEIFILSGCSRLKKFPEVGSNMTRLSNLYLDGTAIDELPLSIEHLTGITLLNLRDCKNLSRCPSTFCGLSSLKSLNLSGCKCQSRTLWQSLGLCLTCATFVFGRYNFITQQLGEEPINLLLPKSISGFSSLVSLDLSDCNLSDTTFPDDLSFLSSLEYLNLSKNNFTHLPSSISQLSHLKYLYLDKCSKLQSFPNPPLSTQFVMARDCTSLEKYSNHVVKWTLGEIAFTIINCLSLIEDRECRTSEVSLVDIDFQPLWQIYMEERISQSKVYYHILPQTEIPEWFSHQNLGSSIRMPLPLDLHDNRSWLGIALFAVVAVHKNLNSQDYKVFIEFNCASDMVQGPVDRRPLVTDISEFLPEPLRHASSFSFKFLLQDRQLRDHLKDCSWISTLITSDSPYVQIKMCGARVVYNKQDLDKLESSQSNDRLKEKLMSLLLTVYQGDLARNHKYDYVFPHMSVPDWFSNRSFCSNIRIKLPNNLQRDGRWMGIAVCAYYTVQERPAISGDNKDLTSFLNFYNPLVSHRVCLTRHKVFQEFKDIFVDSSHRILVFYIPHVLLRLEECRHIGASFEHNKPDVRVKECGLRLVYEQDVEKFVQTLAQCMLESPDAYHEYFYQILLHQVEEREASKDFGFSDSQQRMPQPMPILQPSTENIAEGCSSSETSPSSFTGFLAIARKEQYASIMSSESLIKARLEKSFDEGEIFNCCFAEREIPLWFCSIDNKSLKIPLSPEFVNNPDWMGFALCGLFLFNMHPTAVRQKLASSNYVENLRFSCSLRTSSCNWRLVRCGLLTTGNELVTLNQRAFIWVMFIPRTHAHLWSQSSWVEFKLESSFPDLSAESFGIRLVFRHNMEELTQELKRCSSPFDSFLGSCDPWLFSWLFYYYWENYPEVFIGTKNSYEDLHPQRLFISQEETGATGQYSYEEYLYPHNHLRCFHPSNLYNSCFPTRRTPRWFNHHCRLGHSVTIEIPPNLYEDNNWLGLALYASILIPRDQENEISANSSHFLYCQFQTSKASLDNQILVCRTTDEEHNWLHRLFGLIWISYIPSEALKDILHQCGHIKASFVSDWPSVRVQKCGLRLLYQHDRLQFEQQLKHCNVFISAQRDFRCQLRRHGTRLERMEEFMQVDVRSPVNKYDQLAFDGRSKYSYCFPPVGILHYFKYQSNEPSVKIDISNGFFNDSKWMGLVICVYFSSHEHQTAIIENSNSSISHHLICLLETDIAGQEQQIHVHRTIREEFTWLDIEGGFLWLCYIPCWMFVDRSNQSSCIKASIISDWPGIIVQKCGLSFYHMRDNWFQKIRDHCNMQFAPQDFSDQLTASYKAKTSRAKNQLSESHLLGFDQSCDYNSCSPPIEIPHWFDIQSDESHLRFCLTRKLHNRSTWMGVALWALFSVRGVANLNDIMESKSSYRLICHLQASNGLSVKPRHIYWPTKENLIMMSLLGGFTWLTYIPRWSFPDWLYDCSSINFSFDTNCLDLKVQKCGLHPLWCRNMENFKKCMNTKFDISGILNQKKIENRNRKMRYLIQTGLSKNDPQGFDRCIFFIPQMPSSEILEWFNHRSDEPWLTITLPPNLYNDSTWMGLVLCAYFAIDVKTTAHFDIPDSDTNYHVAYYFETNVGSVRPLGGHCLNKEDLVMVQEYGCILLSFRWRESFQNCLNQVNCIKASFTTNCPGLKVEKCGLRLLYHYDLEEFGQTISHSMNSSPDDVNRDKQKHDGEGTSSRTSSASKESNFGSQRGPIDPKDKGKRVLEE